MADSITIPITPELTAWIESNRAEIHKQPKIYQYLDPGFKQVIDAYDRQFSRPQTGDRVRLSGGYNPKVYDDKWFYVTSVDEKGGLTLVSIGGRAEG